MPPHADGPQQLLLRALVARFWDAPYAEKPAPWGATLYDRWMLPHFIWQDFEDVLSSTAAAGIVIDPQWFAPHFEFRYPRIGTFTQGGVTVEPRLAAEPWHVLGEEPGGGYTARYVDSSLERIQVKASCLTDPRYVLTCNGRCVAPPHGVRGGVRGGSAVPCLAAAAVFASDDWGGSPLGVRSGRHVARSLARRVSSTTSAIPAGSIRLRFRSMPSRRKAAGRRGSSPLGTRPDMLRWQRRSPTPITR